MDEFVNLDATAQAELVRKKKVKPIELVDAAIKRIEALDPKIHAVITPMFDLARKEAKGKLPEGPFKGVPFLLKDLIAFYQGVRMTYGSAALRNFVPDHDSFLVGRIKKSGLLVLGKTNTPEFGFQPTTEPLAYERTCNPWDLTKTSGGSSGGSAAAVAAGMVPMAHGNDGGGSIRIPASCCGIFGLKPTRARTSLGPDFGDLLSGMVTEGGLTRSVRDMALFLDVISGAMPGDPYVAPQQERPYSQEIKIPPGKLRIAFTKKPANEVKVHPDCLQALHETVQILQELGHNVEEQDIALNREELTHAFITVWTTGAALNVEEVERNFGKSLPKDALEPLTWALREIGQKKTAVDYLRSIHILQSVARGVAQQFLKYDLWLSPTLAQPPISLGELDPTPEDPLHGFFRGGDFVGFTPLWNITGQPAMSVPLFWNKGGLPIGSQFIGRFGDEATLFRLAAQLEQARPWAGRHPPNSAFR